jgi:outer membrane biosynthesis protein TonB
MNSGWRIAALLLLSGMAGCNHKVQSGPPAAAQAPIYPPNTVAKDEPLPQPPQPKPLDVQPAPAEVAEQPPPKTKKPAHHKKPADTTQTQAAKDTTAGTPPGTQQVSTGQPPDTSPIGQLSSASDSTGTHTRRQILDEITNTENGLNGIKRTLTSDEQQTATQIRTFLTKAKKALDQDDLDGANTLVAKAKVLLEELTKG